MQRGVPKRRRRRADAGVGQHAIADHWEGNQSATGCEA